MTMFELVDASAVTTGAAPKGTQGDFIEQQKKNCGLIISNVDNIVNQITGWSLLEALFEPIAGDFNAVSSMQLAWGNVGNALGGVGDNYDSLAGQLPAVWQGQGGTAAVSRLGDVAQMHADQKEASGYIAEQLGHVVEVARATVEVIAIALDFIDSIIQELIISGLAGPIGWVKAGVTAPGKARRVVELIHNGLRAIERLLEAVKTVVTVLRYVNAGLGAANSVLGSFNTAGHAAAGSRTDDSAQQGF